MIFRGESRALARGKGRNRRRRRRLATGGIACVLLLVVLAVAACEDAAPPLVPEYRLPDAEFDTVLAWPHGSLPLLDEIIGASSTGDVWLTVSNGYAGIGVARYHEGTIEYVPEMGWPRYGEHRVRGDTAWVLAGEEEPRVWRLTPSGRGRLPVLPEAAGWPWTLDVDSDGRVGVANSSRAAWFERGAWVVSDSFPGNYIEGFAMTTSGPLVVARDGYLWEYRGGWVRGKRYPQLRRLRRMWSAGGRTAWLRGGHAFPDSLWYWDGNRVVFAVDRVYRIAVDGNGRAYVLRSVSRDNQQLLRLDGRSIVPIPGPGFAVPYFGPASPSGFVAGTFDGIFTRWNGNRWVLINGEFLPGPSLVDAAAAVAPGRWVVSSAERVWTRGPNGWTVLGVPFVEGTVTAGLAATGPRDVWWASYHGHLMHFDGEEWRVIPSPTTVRCRGLAADGEGRAVLLRNRSIVVAEPDRWFLVEPGDTLLPRYVRRVDRGHVVVTAWAGGLWHVVRGVVRLERLPVRDPVNAYAESNGGRLAITMRQGLWRDDGTGWRPVADVPVLGDFMDMTVSGGTTWIIQAISHNRDKDWWNLFLVHGSEGSWQVERLASDISRIELPRRRFVDPSAGPYVLMNQVGILRVRPGVR